MEQGGKVMTIAMLIILAFILQGFLIYGDSKDTPNKAAVEFIKSYYKVDRSMKERLCTEILENEEINVVDEYIHRMTEEVKARGFGPDYAKSVIFGLGVETLRRDESSAVIKITGSRKVSINPVFTIIAKLFCIGKSYKVEETLNLIKEDGHWKVCGNPFSLSG